MSSTLVFYAIATVLTLLVVGWLVRPLLRHAPDSGVTAERLNAAIYRDQLAALERDLASGGMTPADYETIRDELQLRLLDDTREELPGATAPASASPAAGFLSARRTAALMTVVLVVGAAGGYYRLGGGPEAIDPVAAQSMGSAEVKQMVEGLAARMKANPGDVKGWVMLVRSYKVMGMFDEAEQAVRDAGPLLETSADLLTQYADLLGVRAGKNLEGRPMELINKALLLEPLNATALLMSGWAAYNRGDFRLAVVQWEKLLPQLEPGSPDARQMENDVADARTKAGLPAGSATVAGAGVLSADASNAGKLPPVDPAAAASMTPDKINEMVDRLAARLKQNPDDAAGWARLARAYKVQKRLPEAEQAFAKAAKVVDQDPDLLTQYADLLASLNNNNLEGKPLALVNKALVLNPRHPVALMLAGTAAFQRADYMAAVGHWEKVLTVLDPASSDATQVKQEIADARARAALSGPRK
jgi:cytochrome c-type biogenesis protein CcmH